MLAQTIVVGLMTLAPCAKSGDKRPTGYDIAKRAHVISSEGYGGETFDSTMTLYDAKGSVVVAYKLKNFNREGAVDSSGITRGLIRFVGPPDSKGTALLTHEPKRGEESRWLYLSETRQVKQIGAGSKSASFKGSELSYEDMSNETLEKYDYKLLGEAKLGGRSCWRVESKAKFSGSGYSRSITCYDKKEGYALKIEFFDKAGERLKTMLIKGYRKVQGKWRPGVSQVTNHQTGRKTVLKTGNYKLKVKLPARMFTVAQLQRQ